MKLLMRALLLSLLSFNAVAQQPYRVPGVIAVAVAAPIQTVAVTMPAGGVLDSMRVLTQGSEGLDYTDAGGGSCAVGTTYLAGQSCTVRIAFKPSAPGERRGAIVLLARAGGTPLATQWLTAAASGPVANFIPGTIQTVAGDSAWIFAGDSQPATQTSIFLPFGLAVDGAGNLFLTDSSNSRIRRVDAITGLVSTVAGSGTIGSTGDGGPATQATLSNPTSIVLDAAGNIFFTDSGNNVVRRVDAFTGMVTTVAGRMGSHGYTGDLMPATAATLNGPNGIALDAVGDLYIADSGNHVIRLVNAATGAISTLAGRGLAGYTGDGGRATAATLSSPWSVTLAPTGELYIADQNNHSIRRVDRSGTISTIAGNGVAGFGGDGQLASNAQLNEPASVVVDVAGNLYIADSGNNRIRKINAQTGNIMTVAGTAGESFSGDDGPADQAGLYGPYALTLDGQNSLYIADVFHNRIRKIASNAATLSYSPIKVGRASDPLKQSLENDGNAPLTIGSVDAVTNAKIDGATTTCAGGTLLLPLESCVVGADFAPTVTGNPVLGNVSIKSDAGNAPSLIKLTGQVLDIDPTTLTLAASANPGFTGHDIVFTATASSAGSTPTGTVNFLDGTVTLGTAPLQAGGTAAFTIATLAAGQHSITASYAGDASNAAAASMPLLETIKDQQAATIVALASSANPSISGTSINLTATVQTRNQGAGSTAIAGTVTFYDGPTQIGTATVDAGTASLDKGTAVLATSSLTVGVHALTCVYAGNDNDGPSTSATTSQTVQIASTRLALSTSANPSTAGAPVTLSATILSTGGVPTGDVRFLDGSSVLGTAPLSGGGLATLPVAGANWLPGIHTLTAVYDGDAADSGSTSAAVQQTVTIAGSSVTLASSLNPAGLGAQVGITATVSSLGGTPSGMVQFYDGSAFMGSGTLDAQGMASLGTAALKLGAHAITGVYAGDVYRGAATSAPLSQSIETASISAALTVSKNPALFGDIITLTAQVAGSGSKPAGAVAFLDGGTALANAALDPNGVANVSVSTLPIGPHSITATYSGDANHASATTAPVSVNVLQSTSTALTTSANQVFAGLPVTLTAAVRGASGKAVTGSVQFTDGGTILAGVAVDAGGNAAYSATLPPGQHSIMAAYAGDSLNAPSTSLGVSETVDLATTSTSLASSANPSAAGASVTFTAIVTGNGGSPTGSITFQDGAAMLATVPLSGTTATLSLATLAPGIHALSATYAGDVDNRGSQSATIQQQVALQTSVRLSSSANPSLLGDSITLTVVASNGGVTSPGGSVTIADGAATIFTGTLTNGSATFTIASPTLGNHALSAAYAGDPQNGPATSAPLVQTVQLRPTTTGLTASSTAISAGQQVILISVVQAPQPGAQLPGGTVTFQSGSTVLGKQTMTAAGVATLTLTPGQAALTIVATYSGDSLYAPSTAAAVPVTVGPPVEFNLTASPPNLTLQSGQRATLGIGLVSATTFKDTLAFGCAGLPADATCTFSVSQMAVASGVPQSLKVTVDTGNPLGAGSAAVLFPLGALMLLALRSRRRLAATLLALLLAVSSVTGCASSFQQSRTPAGDYTFQVVATGNQTGAQGSTTIHMTVTP